MRTPRPWQVRVSKHVEQAGIPGYVENSLSEVRGSLYPQGAAKPMTELLLLDFSINQIACGAWYLANFQALPVGILIW